MKTNLSSDEFVQALSTALKSSFIKAKRCLAPAGLGAFVVTIADTLSAIRTESCSRAYMDSTPEKLHCPPDWPSRIPQEDLREINEILKMAWREIEDSDVADAVTHHRDALLKALELALAGLRSREAPTEHLAIVGIDVHPRVANRLLEIEHRLNRKYPEVGAKAP